MRPGDLPTRLRRAATRGRRLTEQAEDAARRIEELERFLSVWTTTAWIARADVPAGPLVSVIMPTRNRAEKLPTAIGSILDQSYGLLEVVVVDDGSEDETWDVLTAWEDARVRPIRGEQSGVAAARNRGLDEARGSIVAYLDDDNLMHRDWVRSLVWALGRWPDVDVVFGARVIEDSRPYRDIPHEMPILLFEPFDREKLETEVNTVDMNVLAHRAGIPQARFDESLTGCADWDLVLRLTESKPPLALPVLAALYGTSASNRLSVQAEFWEEWELIRARSVSAAPGGTSR